jgi:hypothetical protein
VYYCIYIYISQFSCEVVYFLIEWFFFYLQAAVHCLCILSYTLSIIFFSDVLGMLTSGTKDKHTVIHLLEKQSVHSMSLFNFPVVSQ